MTFSQYHKLRILTIYTVLLRQILTPCSPIFQLSDFKRFPTQNFAFVICFNNTIHISYPTHSSFLDFATNNCT